MAKILAFQWRGPLCLPSRMCQEGMAGLEGGLSLRFNCWREEGGGKPSVQAPGTAMSYTNRYGRPAPPPLSTGGPVPLQIPGAQDKQKAATISRL